MSEGKAKRKEKVKNGETQRGIGNGLVSATTMTKSDIQPFVMYAWRDKQKQKMKPENHDYQI